MKTINDTTKPILRIGDLVFKTFPRLHQYLALLELVNIKPMEGKALFISKGMGKSKIVIDWIANAKPRNILIICPKIALKTWKDEFVTHAYKDIRPTRILNKDKHNLPLWNKPIIVTTYDVVRTMGMNFFRSRSWHAVVLDESTRIKNPKAISSKIILGGFIHVPYRIILSGRPRTNSDLDYFAQYQFLDNGRTFGNSISQFKFQYFFLGWNYQWILSPTFKRQFFQKLASKAIIYTTKFMEKHEGKRFPKAITRNIFMGMNPIQRQYMTSLLDEFRVVLDTKTIYETNWRLAVDQKQRQICAGFLYYKGGVIRFPHPKIKAMKEILEDIDGKVVIFTSFKEEIMILQKIIRKWYPKRSIISLQSGMSVDDVDIAITKHEMSDDGILLSNASMAKYSLSLSSTKYAIYHTRSFSFDTYDQSRGRIARLTSRFPNVYYYNLIYRASIDQIIHDALKYNWSQSQYFTQAVENLRKIAS